MRHQGTTWLRSADMCLKLRMSSCIDARVVSRTDGRLEARVKRTLGWRYVGQYLCHDTTSGFVLVKVPIERHEQMPPEREMRNG